jgi:hypothetical protein
MKIFYLNHMENGYTFEQIDELDFFYYMDLLIYKAGKKDIHYMDEDF